MTRARRQITYHGGDNGKNMPIFSVDMHPDTDPLLLATAGTDAETRVRFLARHALFARKRALTRPPLSLSRCLPLARSGQVWLVPSPKVGASGTAW